MFSGEIAGLERSTGFYGGSYRYVPWYYLGSDPGHDYFYRYYHHDNFWHRERVAVVKGVVTPAFADRFEIGRGDPLPPGPQYRYGGLTAFVRDDVASDGSWVKCIRMKDASVAAGAGCRHACADIRPGLSHRLSKYGA